ncbi:MAG: tryptophan 7-halogenase, partial [Kordiimonas sp.]
LIGKHYKVPFISKKDVLFIDKALAVQVPYSEPDADIESATLSTAQKAGWIWDIGLPSRRGVGYVFSTAHSSIDDAKEELRNYLRPDVENAEDLTFRELDIRPGHREKFWVNNCVAVGMSSGFLEPLEASALVMVEMAANTISLQLPASREAMDVVAKNYNEVFQFRWGRIIDFLKLHYILSKREDTQFWIDNKKEESIPQSLRDLLTLWRYQPPSNNGFLSPYDLFPAASYQYILYGMGFRTEPCHLDDVPSRVALADQHLKKASERKVKIPPLLPSNRELINAICARGKAPVVNLATSSSANCVPVALSALTHLSKHVPLFFQQQKDTKTLSCVALLGLAAHENLTHIGHDQITNLSKTSSGMEGALNTISHMDLLEPVKLDIVFNDNSSVMIEGLHVFSQEKLAKLSAENKKTLEQNNLLPVIKHMLDSLTHVSALIEKKNQLLGAKRATA